MEDVEILFSLKSSLNNDIAYPLIDIHALEILSEFMSENDARSIATPNGLDLFRLSH